MDLADAFVTYNYLCPRSYTDFKKAILGEMSNKASCGRHYAEQYQSQLEGRGMVLGEDRVWRSVNGTRVDMAGLLDTLLCHGYCEHAMSPLTGKEYVFIAEFC